MVLVKCKGGFGIIVFQAGLKNEAAVVGCICFCSNGSDAETSVSSYLES